MKAPWSGCESLSLFAVALLTGCIGGREKTDWSVIYYHGDTDRMFRLGWWHGVLKNVVYF